MTVASETGMMLRATDHGRRVAEPEFFAATGQSGFLFELINGRLYVSPAADAPHDDLLEWLRTIINQYRVKHPGVIRQVSGHARVYLPGRRFTTCPQPDLALYSQFPEQFPRRRRNWKDRRPVIVVEVSSSDIDKDLIRNVKLYREVPSIKEYWVFIDAEDDEDVVLRVYRRSHTGRWKEPIDVPYGGTYSTPVLPGFNLIVRPD